MVHKGEVQDVTSLGGRGPVVTTRGATRWARLVVREVLERLNPISGDLWVSTTFQGLSLAILNHELNVLVLKMRLQVLNHQLAIAIELGPDLDSEHAFTVECAFVE